MFEIVPQILEQTQIAYKQPTFINPKVWVGLYNVGPPSYKLVYKPH